MNNFNLNSNQDLSRLLFGGVTVIKVKEPVIDEVGNIVLIKSGLNKGQIKMVLKEKEIKIKGLGIKPLKEWKTKKDGIYQTGETILLLLNESLGLGHPAKKLISLILNVRGLNKSIRTYYDGVLDKIYPDGCVRPNYNHTSTATGRLSANNPNLQNIPRVEE